MTASHSEIISLNQRPAIFVSSRLEEHVAIRTKYKDISCILIQQEVLSFAETQRFVNRPGKNLIVANDIQAKEAITLLSTSLRRQTQTMQELKRRMEYYERLIDIESFEDLLQLMHSELLDFGLKQPPILAIVLWDGRLVSYLYQGKMVSSKVCREVWSDQAVVRSSDPLDMKFLVQEFGRPFGKVVAFPMRPALGEKRTGSPVSTFFFEHDLNESRARELAEFVAVRIEPTAFAIEHLVLGLRLRQTTHLWAQTFNAFRDPLAIISNNYSIEMANEAFWRESPSAQGLCYEVLMKRSEPCTECPLKSTFSAGLPQQAEVRSKGSDFLLNSYPIHILGESAPVTVVHHYQDVTADKELRGKMIQNEKMVELGKLAGHIAHELNNPLTGIRSMAQVLQKTIVDGPKNIISDLYEIEQAAARSQKIIESLIDFAQSENRNEPLKTVSLHALIDRTLLMLRSALRNHELALNYCTEEPLVFVDPQLVQQVIFNLVNNACQAMPEPGTLTIATELIGSEQTRFRVCDTGVGISEENQKRVFETFFTTKEQGTGTGLGLSLSRRIIEQFGGHISFKSELNKGSCFDVVLPLAAASRKV